MFQKKTYLGHPQSQRRKSTAVLWSLFLILFFVLTNVDIIISCHSQTINLVNQRTELYPVINSLHYFDTNLCQLHDGCLRLFEMDLRPLLCPSLYGCWHLYGRQHLYCCQHLSGRQCLYGQHLHGEQCHLNRHDLKVREKSKHSHRQLQVWGCLLSALLPDPCFFGLQLPVR